MRNKFLEIIKYLKFFVVELMKFPRKWMENIQNLTFEKVLHKIIFRILKF